MGFIVFTPITQQGLVRLKPNFKKDALNCAQIPILDRWWIIII